MEVQIDESCTQIIVRRQPAASDLRMVMTVVKTITDLERIGDEAAKIARMGKLLSQRKSLVLPRYTEIKQIAELALDMLRKSLDAFARLDLFYTAQVVRQDELVDDEFRTILRYLITYMMEDPRTISLRWKFCSSPRPLNALAIMPRTCPNMWFIWSRAKTCVMSMWKKLSAKY